MASVQVNDRQVMVFGGYYENDSGSKQSFVFEVAGGNFGFEDLEGFLIKDINYYQLEVAEVKYLYM